MSHYEIKTQEQANEYYEQIKDHTSTTSDNPIAIAFCKAQIKEASSTFELEARAGEIPMTWGEVFNNMPLSKQIERIGKNFVKWNNVLNAEELTDLRVIYCKQKALENWDKLQETLSRRAANGITDKDIKALKKVSTF